MTRIIIIGAIAALLSPLTALGAPGDADLGRDLFDDMNCGMCHALSDAGAEGTIGPSLDGNPNLSDDLIMERVSYGQGAMPPFGGQLSNDELAAIAAYVLEAAE